MHHIDAGYDIALGCARGNRPGLSGNWDAEDRPCALQGHAMIL